MHVDIPRTDPLYYLALILGGYYPLFSRRMTSSETSARMTAEEMRDTLYAARKQEVSIYDPIFVEIAMIEEVIMLIMDEQKREKKAATSIRCLVALAAGILSGSLLTIIAFSIYSLF